MRNLWTPSLNHPSRGRSVHDAAQSIMLNTWQEDTIGCIDRSTSPDGLIKDNNCASRDSRIQFGPQWINCAHPAAYTEYLSISRISFYK